MDDGQRSALQGVLLSEGWREFMKPEIANLAEFVKTQNVLRAPQRAKDYQDAHEEFLRGMFYALTWASQNWEQRLAVDAQNRMAERMNQNGLEPLPVGSPYGDAAPEGADA